MSLAIMVMLCGRHGCGRCCLWPIWSNPSQNNKVCQFFVIWQNLQTKIDVEFYIGSRTCPICSEKTGRYFHQDTCCLPQNVRLYFDKVYWFICLWTYEFIERVAVVVVIVVSCCLAADGSTARPHRGGRQQRRNRLRGGRTSQPDVISDDDDEGRVKPHRRREDDDDDELLSRRDGQYLDRFYTHHFNNHFFRTDLTDNWTVLRFLMLIGPFLLSFSLL